MAMTLQWNSSIEETKFGGSKIDESSLAFNLWVQSLKYLFNFVSFQKSKNLWDATIFAPNFKKIISQSRAFYARFFDVKTKIFLQEFSRVNSPTWNKHDQLSTSFLLKRCSKWNQFSLLMNIRLRTRMILLCKNWLLCRFFKNSNFVHSLSDLLNLGQSYLTLHQFF